MSYSDEADFALDWWIEHCDLLVQVQRACVDVGEAVRAMRAKALLNEGYVSESQVFVASVVRANEFVNLLQIATSDLSNDPVLGVMFSGSMAKWDRLAKIFEAEHDQRSITFNMNWFAQEYIEVLVELRAAIAELLIAAGVPLNDSP